MKTDKREDKAFQRIFPDYAPDAVRVCACFTDTNITQIKSVEVTLNNC